MRPWLDSWGSTCSLPCEMPRGAERGSFSRGPFSHRINSLQEYLPQVMAGSIHTVLENTEAQMTATLVTWLTEDSLVIKTCAVGILMLFLTSQAPLPVILSKSIIQNVVRRWFEKIWPLEHQVFLLFALLWVKNKSSLTTPLMSNFYLVGKAIFLLSFSAPIMLLFERNQSIPVYHAYLKSGNPVVNIKWYTLWWRDFYFQSSIYYIILFPSPWKQKIQFL